MKFIGTNCPIDDPTLHNQTEQYIVNDEEFDQFFVPKSINTPTKVKILRFIYFFLFLGPIRIVCTLLGLLSFYILVSVLPIFEKYWKRKRDFKNWAFKVCYPTVRITLLSMGIIRMKLKGKLDQDTRTLVSNHLTLFDCVAILSQFPICFLGMISLKKISFIQHTARIFDIIFVDRTTSDGHISPSIQDIQNDPSQLPLVIFSEGKISNGDCILGLRTGAFISDTPIQPLTIRYKMWLTPKELGSVSWVEEDPVKYIYQLFSIPFITCEITLLDPISFKGSNKTVEERAEVVQLMMANNLGCRAIDRTNKYIFQRNELEKEKEKKKNNKNKKE